MKFPGSQTDVLELMVGWLQPVTLHQFPDDVRRHIADVLRREIPEIEAIEAMGIQAGVNFLKTVYQVEVHHWGGTCWPVFINGRNVDSAAWYYDADGVIKRSVFKFEEDQLQVFE